MMDSPVVNVKYDPGGGREDGGRPSLISLLARTNDFNFPIDHRVTMFPLGAKFCFAAYAEH